MLFFATEHRTFSGSGYAITKMGCNLPAMMVRHFRGDPIYNQDFLEIYKEYPFCCKLFDLHYLICIIDIFFVPLHQN